VTIRLVCGRLSAEACGLIEAAVRRQLVLTPRDTVIVADSSCPPGAFCPLQSTSAPAAIVAVVQLGLPHAGVFWPPTYSFHGPDVLTPWSGSRPAFFIALLRSAGIPVVGLDAPASEAPPVGTPHPTSHGVTPQPTSTP
jgi:hypothetical protein